MNKMNLDLGPLVNHLLGTQKGPRSIEEVVAELLPFFKKESIRRIKRVKRHGL